MGNLFHDILFQPLLNLLVVLYTYLGQDMGVAIVSLTILLRLALNPFSVKAIRSQRKLQELSPKIEELKKKYKDQKEVLARETMRVYKEANINPFSSCLPIVIQIPIFIAVYQVFSAGVGSIDSQEFYSFIPHPAVIGVVGFGFLNLAKPNILLAVLAALAQYWQSRMMVIQNNPHTPLDDRAAMMSKQMTYVLPCITLLFGIKLPAGLTLYWFVTTLLMGLQQHALFRKNIEVTQETR